MTAEAGRATLDSEPAGTQAAFVTIQETGRQTLSQMREVVRGLREGAPTEPQPVLATARPAARRGGGGRCAAAP